MSVTHKGFVAHAGSYAGVNEPPQAVPAFSLIIPAYNEKKRIVGALKSYLEAFSDGEVILVCNGCTDGTEDVARLIASERNNLRVISIPHSIGKGGAVRAGFLAARAPVVGYVDADGATPADEIRRLFSLVDGDIDAVIASRWSKGAKVEVAQPFKRRIASRAFNLFVRVLFGLPFQDTQCGAKVFKAESLREITHQLEVANFAFDIDVLHALRLRGRKILEVPTVWRDVDGSRVDLPRASTEMLKALIRLRMRYSLFRYIIPLFDRAWPTKPLKVRTGLAILLLNWRDPKHPQAGGAERYLLEVGRRLVERGHRVEWLTAGFPGCTRQETIDGIRIHRVGGRVSVYWLLPLTYLRRFRDRFDAIIDAENGVPFFSPFFSLKPKVCLVFHVHQSVFKKHLKFPINAMFCWIEAVLMPFAYRRSRFIAISGDTRRELTGLGIPEDHIDQAVSGVDEYLKPLTKADRPTLVYVGRLKEYKRVELLLNAVPSLLQRHPDLEVRIAGSGDYESELKTRAVKLGIEDCVIFEGFVDEDRKRQILASAWIFVMPSEMEGWGLTITEAAACGTLSVGYDIPGVREAIIDGATGVLVRDDVQLLSELDSLLTDRERRNSLSANALLSSKQYSWDRTADSILESLQFAQLQESGRLVFSDHIDEGLPEDSIVNALPKPARPQRRSSNEIA